MYNGHFQTLEESFRVIVTVSRLLGLLVMICTNFCRYQICERCEIDFRVHEIWKLRDRSVIQR